MRQSRNATPKFCTEQRDRTRSHAAKSEAQRRRKVRAAKRAMFEAR